MKMDSNKERIQFGLVEASAHWAENFQDCNRFWTSATQNPHFWVVAAEICMRHDIPPILLIPLVQGFLNDGPGEVTVKFHCNVMKSEGLMERAIANVRIYCRDSLQDLESVAIIAGRKSEPKRSIIENLHLIAELVLENYRIGLEVLNKMVAPRGAEAVPMADQVQDVIAYQSCEQNPFMLMDAAKTPLLRHLAFNNLRALVRYQPWTEKIWEGLIGPGAPFNDITAYVGEPLPNSPFHGPNWAWPPTPSMAYEVFEKPVHPTLRLPKLYLNRPLFNQNVSAYIAIKKEAKLKELGQNFV